MDVPVFDSRDLRYKAPYGAVPCGTEIRLTLRPPLAEGLVDCTLLVLEEFSDLRLEIPLLPAGSEDGCALFAGSYVVPREPDLLWFSFRFRGGDGRTLWLGRNGFCGEGQADPWQQTVYDASLPVPGWFGRGVTYQIFPDRFRRLALPDVSGMVGCRTLHQSWDDRPELPEDQGKNANCDFFGGSLRGIIEKLDYLRDLGVTTLYLCPVFESASNHRYNTGDYEKIDPMLGTEEDFRELCAQAHARGLRVMLDGVFNHTGSNSRYFNLEGFYPDTGAAQSKDSPYFPWYTFRSWPEEYESWWGFKTLPSINEMHPDYQDYIIEGKDSVIRRWLRLGADAWRLDVADELPDEFIARIRAAMAEEKPDSFLLGEVWEDGSNKISYGLRRKYLLGRETHGLMNYPFRTAALAYLRRRDENAGPYGAEDFREAMETIREHYPPSAFYSAMNMLGTHDTARAVTLLGCAGQPATRRERAVYAMTDAQRARGLALLKLGALLLYTFPGSPTVFYGDEAGMEGWEDPMNRGSFPWGQEDLDLQAYYRELGRLRRLHAPLQTGELRWLHAAGPVLAFERRLGEERLVSVLNAADSPLPLRLPWEEERAVDLLTGQRFSGENGSLSLSLPPLGGLLLYPPECFT